MHVHPAPASAPGAEVALLARRGSAAGTSSTPIAAAAEHVSSSRAAVASAPADPGPAHALVLTALGHR